jgi:integrase
MTIPRERETAAPGIYIRHRLKCGHRQGKECTCRPSYQAVAWSARDGKPIRRTLYTLAQARRWRRETQVALSRRQMMAPSAKTISEASKEWLEGAKAGVIRTRSGERYKPSTLRGYERSLLRRIGPLLGKVRISSLERNAVQDLVDRWVAEGLGASTVRNELLPLQAIYRRAKSRGEVAVNPTIGLSLPKDRGRRDRVAPPTEAHALLRALPEDLRPIWATAMYAGLRLGELRGLRWEDVDLDKRVIRVQRGWDPVVGPIEPKSRAGRRRVPIADTLRSHLLEHRLRQGRGGTGLVFGKDDSRPFDSSWATERARRAWNEAGLSPLTLHECRHTCASLMIAAGVNAKALSTYLGHTSITVTLDRYGHLMPGSEREAAGLLEALIGKPEGASESARLAAP